LNAVQNIPDATPPLPTIIVADDDQVTRLMLRHILSRQNYRVIEVENGLLACEAARRLHPDIILLDWSMPLMDGLAALKVLKSDASTRSIPVIMLTSQAEMAERVLALEAGAQDFLTKPCDPRELVARTNQHRHWRDLVAEDISAGAALTLSKETESDIKRLRHSAMHDFLTGLPNRVLLHERMDHTIAYSKRRNESFAVLFLDLDGFKQINDARGHAVGDEVLRIVATRIEGICRESDTVARIGGDEFMVLAPNMEHPRNARELAGRLTHSLALPMRIGDVAGSVSASIGISIYPFDGTTRETLSHLADSAMYAAKQSGKNCYCSCSSEAFYEEWLARAALARATTSP